MEKILIIDDDTRLNQTLVRIMARMGHHADGAHTLTEAREYLSRNQYALVFLDVRLPDGNGLDALPDVLESPGRPEVVILTGNGDPDGAELAIQGGAWDYLLKPSSVKQTMLCVERALKYHHRKTQSPPTDSLDLSSIVGLSPKMEICYEQIGLAARSVTNVLITGETGTGKELVARTIHDNSKRKHGDFVPVDCASLNKGLVESTLFGHKRGTFTGADRDRMGLVRVADKGTLFLDEVGDMDLPIQKTFLRVLQERRYRPVGETREIESDFRLIAATNRHLDDDVTQERFRKDLLYRLKTIHIQLPPLRERDGDVRLLALFRINQLNREYDRQTTLAPETFEALSAYRWPGNIRELFAAMETAFFKAEGMSQIIPRHLPASMRVAATRAHVESAAPNQEPADTAPLSSGMQAVRNQTTLKNYKQQMERHYLEELCAHADGNMKMMVEISGCSQSHLYSLLKKAGLSLK